MTSPIEIFCCYARRDKLLLNGVIAHLTLFQRVGLICLSADTDITAGEEWESEIEKDLNKVQIRALQVSQQTKRRMRILVVDDIKVWREELVKTLQSGGFHVDSVSSAAEALKRLDEAVYHLLITDIRQDESDPNNIGGLVLLREMEKRGL